MATRLEELHGHQYAMQRVVSAMTRHDPDPGGSRAPRTLTLALVSALIAALILVGVLVVNVVTGRGSPTSLRSSTTVLIEKETGAQYVYTDGDDRLHPVLNYASGLLLANGSGQAPSTVRRGKLASMRRDAGLQVGATLGIPGAPDALPRKGDLLRDEWNVCLRTGATGEPPRTDLLIGAGAVTGGRPLAVPAAGATAEALLVRSPDRQTFLVFGNRKLLVAAPAVMLAAFGWTGRQPQPVSAAWLKALPAGPDIATPAIPGRGEQSTAVRAPVGRLFTAPGPNGNQWAVVRRNEVQTISEVQALLLQADPRTNVGAPVTVSTSDLVGLRPAPPPDDAGQLPATVPTLASFTSGACIRVPDAGAGVTAVVVNPAGASTAPAPAPSTGTGAGALAGQVSVPFGRGVLVRAVASPTAGADTGTLSIVTDNGLRYPIGDRDALTRLGYGSSTPLGMPSALVTLVPAGPELSIAAAQQVQ